MTDDPEIRRHLALWRRQLLEIVDRVEAAGEPSGEDPSGAIPSQNVNERRGAGKSKHAV